MPLRVEDAEEMTGVLGDERLDEFIGGEPETITGRESVTRGSSPALPTRPARALVGWLRQHGADNVVAHIHPGHQASATVAMRAGLRRRALDSGA